MVSVGIVRMVESMSDGPGETLKRMDLSRSSTRTYDIVGGGRERSRKQAEKAEEKGESRKSGSKKRRKRVSQGDFIFPSLILVTRARPFLFFVSSYVDTRTLCAITKHPSTSDYLRYFHPSLPSLCKDFPTRLFGAPICTIFPPSNTTTLSHPLTVSILCAIMITVHSNAITTRWTSLSVPISTEAVASSMMRIFGRRRSARARQMSWHWPRENGEFELEGIGVSRYGRDDIASGAMGVFEEGNDAGSADAEGEEGFEPAEKNRTWRRTS